MNQWKQRDRSQGGYGFGNIWGGNAGVNRDQPFRFQWLRQHADKL
jgi:hypothetical protein